MHPEEWMNRPLLSIASALLVALALPACNEPACGPGTKQVQQQDGSLRCEPADGLPSSIVCNTDAGAAIVGGECVSAISCGANTQLNPATGQCESTGGGGGVPQCSAPTSGHACFNGALLNFLDNSPFTGMVHVKIYDPVTLLGNGAPIDQGDFSGGGYIFPNIAAPALGLIAIVVGDADGSDTTYVNCASGTQMVSAGNKYRVDGYVMPKAVTDGWKASPAALDIGTNGAYVAKFYSDMKEAPTAQIANEMNPVAGVQLYENNNPIPDVKYFDTSLASISTTLTATSAVGGAIVPAPVMGSFPIFTGMGPASAPVTWESLPGGSLAGLVFVTRFHPN